MYSKISKKWKKNLFRKQKMNKLRNKVTSFVIIAAIKTIVTKDRRRIKVKLNLKKKQKAMKFSVFFTVYQTYPI